MALLLWDYDGVLVNSMTLEEIYFPPACQAVGIDQIRTYADVARLCEGNFYEECIKAGIDLMTMKQALRNFANDIRGLEHLIDFYPRMRDTVTELAQKFPSFIITSNHTRVVTSMLDHHGVTGIRAVLGADTETSKVKKINLVKESFPGETAYFISDTTGDIREARESNVDIIIGVTWGVHSRETLMAAEPDYLFDETSQLEDFLYRLMQ